MRKSLFVKSALASILLMTSITGAAVAAPTTGVDLKPSVQATSITKRIVTHSVFYTDNMTIPGTITRTITDSRGTWAGVLDRERIEKVDNGYIAHFRGYVYLEN
ncbi:hypothetical protein [Paenibacillus pinihumi]|uniref:hypothetical protein n=1 Tax=Paenibacillus pinihumi TaxID=669462 RepID=UPI00048C3FD5|nr:hypothetical protein [Paenibacillus pinihumi]